MKNIKLIRHWQPGEEVEFTLLAEDKFPFAELSVPSAFGEAIDFLAVEKYFLERGIKIPNVGCTPLRWRERLLAFKDFENQVSAGKDTLLVAQIDSVSLKALAQGLITYPTYSCVGTSGITRTLDAKLLMGVRGNVDDALHASVIPSGGINWPFTSRFKRGKTLKNYIQAMVRKEGSEEAALHCEDIASLDMIGVYRLQLSRNDKPCGDAWFSCTYLQQLQTSTPEIMRRFKKSREQYSNFGGGTDNLDDELIARTLLQQVASCDADIAVDVWENDRLITPIDFDVNDPDAFLGSIKEFLQGDISLRMSQFGVLSLVALRTYGVEVCDDLQRIPTKNGLFGDIVDLNYAGVRS